MNALKEQHTLCVTIEVVKKLIFSSCVFLFLSGLPSFDVPPEAVISSHSDFDSLNEMVQSDITISRGDTLGSVLGSRIPEGVYDLIEELKQHVSPRSVMPGWTVSLFQNRQGFIGEVVIASDEGWKIRTSRWVGAWESEVIPGLVIFSPVYLSGTIETSLMESFNGLELSPSLALEFVSIFQWDIDFFRDIRRGDSFSILYNQSSGNRGEHILFARCVCQREEHFAMKFGDGFYNRDGRPLKKAFLKAPLRVATITSGFSSSRIHPVLNRKMPHYGVDYAAPAGTPVVATAGGKVTFRGFKKGWGNTISLRHPNNIVTHYLHLSRFPRSIREGSRVAQGDVIGYVGQTGLSTGPHVDYRITRNGQYINPLRFKSPAGPPLPEMERTEFLALVKQTMTRWML